MSTITHVGLIYQPANFNNNNQHMSKNNNNKENSRPRVTLVAFKKAGKESLGQQPTIKDDHDTPKKPQVSSWATRAAVHAPQVVEEEVHEAVVEVNAPVIEEEHTSQPDVVPSKPWRSEMVMPGEDLSKQRNSLIGGAQKARRCAECTKPISEMQEGRLCNICAQQQEASRPSAPLKSTAGKYVPPAGRSRWSAASTPAAPPPPALDSAAAFPTLGSTTKEEAPRGRNRRKTPAAGEQPSSASSSRSASRSPPATMRMTARTVRVHNIGDDTISQTEFDLREVFGRFGRIDRIGIPKDWDNHGSHRGFAFVDFHLASDATAVIAAAEQNPIRMDHLILDVQLQDERETLEQQWGGAANSERPEAKKYDFAALRAHM